MELRHLRYFVALAERLNFTQAAAQTHVSQSTLSHQIRQLEEQLGQALFERTKRRVTLTAAGELFLPKAMRALSELDGGIALLSASPAEFNGQLRVGTTPTFNVDVIPRAVAAFTERHPGVRVLVQEDVATGIVGKVLSGASDIAVGYQPADEARVSFEPLCNEELVLVVGPRHPFASRRRVRVIELHRRELIVVPAGFATRRMLEDVFASAGAVPVIRVESDSMGAMLATVGHSQLATIVSRHAVQADSRCKIIPLESPTPMRTTGLLRLRDRAISPAEASFASILRQATTQADFQHSQRKKSR
ncbi:MAG TPA: LysR substrate-binding domain-containing protein [Ramlibacter sp.]|nr:LysR substrate-binding domain-containing protein [Ramlibacter sp.]